jgi:hypothetical protein
MCLLPCPEGAFENSLGRKPQVPSADERPEPRRGDAPGSIAPSGLRSLCMASPTQGFRPGLFSNAPSGQTATLGRSRFEGVLGPQDLLPQGFRVGQVGQVARREDLGRHVAHRVVHHGIVLVVAENDADRLVLAGLGEVFLGVGQVEAHLPGVGVRELADLQVDVSVRPRFIGRLPIINNDQSPEGATPESVAPSGLIPSLLAHGSRGSASLHPGLFSTAPSGSERQHRPMRLNSGP